MFAYISSIDMSVLVYDYDQDAQTPEELADTHERMFIEFRKAKPKTPVLILSHPYGKFNTDVDLRQKIIKRTYENAKRSGDENVYLLLASEYFPDELGADFSVDNIHPNDIGLMYMEKAISPKLGEILKSCHQK